MITEATTGLVEGMPFADYLATEACSASRLKSMRSCPARCRYEMDNPKDSPALAFGRAFHTFVLEPEAWRDQYAVTPNFGDCRVKANKTARDEWRIDHQDKQAIDADDAAVVADMAKALCLHPGARRLLTLPGRNELSGFWVDEKTGLLCKLRADRVVDFPGLGRVCFDLKTTDDASPEDFPWTVKRYGYALQGAFYLEGLARMGEPCDVFVIGAVEKGAPHLVGVYGVDDPSIEKGAAEWRELLDQYAACKATGVWPGYGDAIEMVNLPNVGGTYAGGLR